MASLSTFVQHLKDARDEQKYAHVRNSRFAVRFQWDNTYEWNKTIIGIPGQTKENTIQDDLSKDIDYYVKTVNVPNLKIGGRPYNLDDNSEAGLGDPGYSQLLIQNSLLMPQEMNFSIEFYDTEISFIDNFIEPWARACVSPVNTLCTKGLKNTTSIPYATIFVDIFSKSTKIFDGNINTESDVNTAIRTYKLCKVWPSIIDNPELTHDNSDFLVRKVEFNFSKMYIIPQK